MTKIEVTHRIASLDDVQFEVIPVIHNLQDQRETATAILKSAVASLKESLGDRLLLVNVQLSLEVKAFVELPSESALALVEPGEPS